MTITLTGGDQEENWEIGRLMICSLSLSLLVSRTITNVAVLKTEGSSLSLIPPVVSGDPLRGCVGPLPSEHLLNPSNECLGRKKVRSLHVA